MKTLTHLSAKTVSESGIILSILYHCSFHWLKGNFPFNDLYSAAGFGGVYWNMMYFGHIAEIWYVWQTGSNTDENSRSFYVKMEEACRRETMHTLYSFCFPLTLQSFSSNLKTVFLFGFFKTRWLATSWRQKRLITELGRKRQANLWELEASYWTKESFNTVRAVAQRNPVQKILPAKETFSKEFLEWIIYVS